MVAERIPDDFTIETVWSGLTHQRPYVSGVLHKMRVCQKAHGNAHVRIGVTGTGQKPYYRVFSIDKEANENIFGSFYDNHDPLENAFVLTANWSSRAMAFKDVEDFFAGKIGFDGVRPK
jgi:hypothetical protein